MSNVNNAPSWVERFAYNVYRFLGDFAIPFTTPFFAIYNCHKLMESAKNQYLKAFVFAVSMIYVIMTLCLAIYFVFAGTKK